MISGKSNFSYQNILRDAKVWNVDLKSCIQISSDKKKTLWEIERGKLNYDTAVK